MAQSASPALPRLNVILVEPEIAANTGSIGRTCVAAGATLWLVRPLGFHLDDRHLRRAALDYWEHLELRVVNSLHDVNDALEAGSPGISVPGRREPTPRQDSQWVTHWCSARRLVVFPKGS